MFGEDVMIVPFTALQMVQIEPLVSESQHEGFQFLARLCEEWASGTNRCSQRGEALFGLFDSGALIGVGGINRQDASTGRLRRFYISPLHRLRGWGKRLVHHILSHATRYFCQRFPVPRQEHNAFNASIICISSELACRSFSKTIMAIP